MRKCIFYLTAIAGFFAGSTGFCQTTTFSLSKLNLSFQAGGLAASVAWKIPSFTADQMPEQQTPCWGFSWNTASVSPVPVKISAGQLTCSGALSKLKSPALSSYVTPFSSAAGNVSSISVSLPSSCVSSRPYGVSMVLDYAKTKGLLRRLNVSQFGDSSGVLVEGASVCISPWKKTEFSFGVTSGVFTIEHTGSEWFSETEFFQSYIQNPVCLQAALSFPIIKSREILCVFPDFSGNYGYTFSSENTLLLKNLFNTADFCLNLSMFSSTDKDIFTASSSLLKTLSQYKANPYVTFYGGNRFKLRIGTTLYAEEKKSEKNIVGTGKISQGINLQSKKINSTVIFNSCVKRNEAGSLEAESYSWVAKVYGVGKTGAGGGCSISWNPDFSKKTYKADVKLSFPQFPVTSISSDLQIQERNSEITSTKIGMAASLRLNKKSLTVSGTAGISVSL